MNRPGLDIGEIINRNGSLFIIHNLRSVYDNYDFIARYLGAQKLINENGTERYLLNFDILYKRHRKIHDLKSMDLTMSFDFDAPEQKFENPWVPFNYAFDMYYDSQQGSSEIDKSLLRHFPRAPPIDTPLIVPSEEINNTIFVYEWNISAPVEIVDTVNMRVIINTISGGKRRKSRRRTKRSKRSKRKGIRSRKNK